MKKTFILLSLFIVTSCNKGLPDNIADHTNENTPVVLCDNKVTPEDAKNMAISVTGFFTNENTKSLSREVFSIEAVTAPVILTKSGTIEPDTLMYVVNYNDDNGYIFISSDRRSGPVIAFVEQGNFSIADTVNNSLDKMLVDLMIDYRSAQLEKFKEEDEQTEKLLENKELFGFFYDEETDTYTKSNVIWSTNGSLYGLTGKNCRKVQINGPGVYPQQFEPRHPLNYYPENGCEAYRDNWELSGGADPLLTTSWNQTAPFNNMAPIDPEYPTEHAYAGCVAIACVQIMAYNNYPLYYPEHLNDGKRTFLESLRLCRTDNDITAANLQDEVSTLVYTVGKLLGNKWGWDDDGTSAYIFMVTDAFRGIGYKNLYGIWDVEYDKKIVFNELIYKRPVLIGGRNTSDKGHVWVIDGYKTMLTWQTKFYFDASGEYDGETRERKREENVYFNCNFGWGGKHNGYYLSGVFNANYESIVPTKNNCTDTKSKDLNYSKKLYIMPGLTKK